MFIDHKILQHYQRQLSTEVYYPKKMVVVLGRSNKAEEEANLAACQKDDIDILKRMGGGGTVLLSKDSLVLSVGAWVQERYENKKYFQLLNQSIIDTLHGFPPGFTGDFYQDGISDICHNQKKIAGTSLFRSRNYLLYQASLLVNLDIVSIDRYLKHPTKEPNYRQGRTHQDFLSSLQVIQPQLNSNDLLTHFQKHFERYLLSSLEGELIEPVVGQYEHLEKKLGEAISF